MYMSVFVLTFVFSHGVFGFSLPMSVDGYLVMLVSFDTSLSGQNPSNSSENLYIFSPMIMTQIYYIKSNTAKPLISSYSMSSLLVRPI